MFFKKKKYKTKSKLVSTIDECIALEQAKADIRFKKEIESYSNLGYNDRTLGYGSSLSIGGVSDLFRNGIARSDASPIWAPIYTSSRSLPPLSYQEIRYYHAPSNLTGFGQEVVLGEVDILPLSSTSNSNE